MPDIVCPDCKKISLYDALHYEAMECQGCGRKFTLTDIVRAIAREGLAEAKAIVEGRPKEPDR